MRTAQIANLMILSWSLAGNSQIVSAAEFASVTINEPGHWTKFLVNELLASQKTGTGPRSYWTSIADPIPQDAFEFYFLNEDPLKNRAEDYGKLDFEVQSDGLVWMLTTARFKDSGGSGPWSQEAISKSQLKRNGWQILSTDFDSEWGYAPAGQNSGKMSWMLYERNCLAGETFSIRTEKYQSPVILRAGTTLSQPPPILPDPADLVSYWDFNDASRENETADIAAGFVGTFVNGAKFSIDGGGRTGLQGDRAADFGIEETKKAMKSADVAHSLNSTASQGEISISFWQQWNTDIKSSSSFSFLVSSGTQFQAQIPWEKGDILFDIAECSSRVELSNFTNMEGNTFFQQWLEALDRSQWRSRPLQYLPNNQPT